MARPTPELTTHSKLVPLSWFYITGTSAGLIATSIASHYYAEQLFEIEPAYSADVPTASTPSKTSELIQEQTQPTVIEPESWQDVLAEEITLWKRDFSTFSERAQAELSENFSRPVPPKPLAARSIEQVAKPKPWQQNLAERTRNQLEYRAQRLVQAAFDRAQQQDFAAAISFLQQVPKGTSVREKAEIKLIEYREMWNVRAEYWLYRAKYLAYSEDYAGAIAYLRQIPTETAVYKEAQQKIPQYVRARNKQADRLLQQASYFAARKRFSVANQYLRLIPQEAPAYAVAKDRIVEYSQKMYADAQAQSKRQTS
ncbi:MAG: hypothetical protein J7641_04695 [Cyanobacteria bacterium SID2]|nr:hypothetical protein [Cyanobacteria bacterium SID2]MBP0005249.1 hypothetical protein [Cyanobacteria bacterium SBC]